MRRALVVAAVIGAMAMAGCASSMSGERMSGDKAMTGDKAMQKGDGMMEKKK